MTKEDWQFINSFAWWISAFGTIFAASVALYISNRAIKLKANTTVGHRIIIGPGSIEPYPELVVFKITNTGQQPIRITHIGWKIGGKDIRQAIQKFDTTMSSPLPITLQHGQEASWLVPLNNEEEHWLDYFAKGMLLPNYKKSLKNIRAQFSTPVGQTFETKLEQDLITMLTEACERNQNAT